MPLDAQTLGFIASATKAPSPPAGSVPLAEFREAVEGFRAYGFPREEVREVRSVSIPLTAGGAVAARVYVPDAADGPLPVVVWVHGGSWVRVTVDLLDPYFRVSANRSGCVVVAVDYTLSPEARFPSALEEVHAVACWAKQHSASAGWDAGRIAIAGESSGGNIAAAVALLDRDRRQVDFAQQTLLVPVLDVEFATDSWRRLGADYLLTAEQLEWAVQQYAPGVDVDDPLLSPLRANDLAGLPPTLIVTGEYDPLRDEGEMYARRLRDAGVPVQHADYPGLIHHALMVPSLIDLGRRVVEETAQSIGEALRRLPVSGDRVRR